MYGSSSRSPLMRTWPRGLEAVAGLAHDPLDEVPLRLAVGRLGAGLVGGLVGPAPVRVRSRRRLEDHDVAAVRIGEPRPTRSTSTRWPTSRVGTIDWLGMRKGLTRTAWIPIARPSADRDDQEQLGERASPASPIPRCATGGRVAYRSAGLSSEPASASLRRLRRLSLGARLASSAGCLRHGLRPLERPPLVGISSRRPRPALVGSVPSALPVYWRSRTRARLPDPPRR